ncbi:MAG: hypothetical protein OXN84_00345, partial [Albidovulum sp.]|nr:hypothetical protein [Albidovulum sp.]
FVLDGAGKRRAKDLEIPDGASFLGSLRKAGAEFDGNVSGYLESNELAHRLFNAAGVIGEAALESGAAFAGQPDRIDAITNGERAVIPDKWE